MDRDFKEVKRELDLIIDKAKELYASVNVDGLKKNLADLEADSQTEAVWQDKERFAQNNRDISILKKRLDPWNKIMTELKDSSELMEIAGEENDQAIIEEIAGNIPSFAKQFDAIETIELLSEEDDAKNVFVTVHAGAGGTESQDWANMLLRMYMRWAETQNYALDMIDYMAGEEAGIKGATILIKGDFAFGMLKGEKGVHRLVRISPFDANKRRHTSFASVEVMPEIADDVEVEINESDLRIDTYRSSGAGGQHVNTTDSAVRITHLPTNTVVSCQNERSQHKNKASAMKVLKAKLYELQKRERESMLEEKAGEKKDISWGNQIRSYVFQPYTLVKDHRTNEETGSVEYVLDGDLNRFIFAYLKFINKKSS